MFTQNFVTAVAATTSIFIGGSNALVAQEASSATSASTLSVSYTTYSALASDYPGVSRNGGGGGNIGGQTLMVFSDTQTKRTGLWRMTSNSYAYTTNPDEPTEEQDFGSDEVPAQAIPWDEGECATEIVEEHPEWCSASNTSAHDGYWIWPNST